MFNENFLCKSLGGKFMKHFRWVMHGVGAISRISKEFVNLTLNPLSHLTDNLISPI